MEQLNRIELRGNVGNVRIQRIGDSTVANLTVATNLAYRGKDGTPIIETTWHTVTAWESKDVRGLDKLERGSKVHIIGRLRNQRFVGSDGIERTNAEVVAKSLELIDGDNPLMCQS